MKRPKHHHAAPKGTGSRPEKVEGCDGEWVARNFTAKEVDEKTGIVKAKVCLPDIPAQDRKYRDNYKETFGHD